MISSNLFSLGQRRFQQDVQATPLCLGASALVPCVENRRWTFGRVTYATLNIQGSCNNLSDTAPDPDEYALRNAANIGWMTATFQDAIARDSAAIMFISQANPGWDATDGTRGVVRNPRTLAETDGLPDGFQEFLLALRQQVIAFGKPVAYVHGDTHYARVDKPLLDASGRRLENFTACRDVRRQSGKWQQRRALDEGAGGHTQSRSVWLSGAGCTGQSNRGAGAVATPVIQGSSERRAMDYSRRRRSNKNNG